MDSLLGLNRHFKSFKEGKEIKPVLSPNNKEAILLLEGVTDTEKVLFNDANRSLLALVYKGKEL